MTQPMKAIVTGGSTGIAICRASLEPGYEAISLALRTPRVSSLQLHSVQVDLSDPLAMLRAAAEFAAMEPVTTIVHNAGAILEKSLEQYVRAAAVQRRNRQSARAARAGQ
jgi:NAD(P)-dependent dehydrogenase (short-subunit alcohol dehydrogenase family)